MAQGDRVLFWGSGSAPCWKVMIVLEEKGLEYASRLMEFSKGEHKSPEVLALNPRGQLPTFKDGDIVVNESLAAIVYLDEAYPQPAVSPQDVAARAKMWQRLAEALVLQDKLSLVVRMKMTGQVKTAEDEQVFAGRVQDAKKELATWEAYLGGSPFAGGDSFSLADAMLAPALLSLQRYGATLRELPSVKAYAERMAARPSIQKTWPPHWKTSPAQTWLADHV